MFDFSTSKSNLSTLSWFIILTNTYHKEIFSALWNQFKNKIKGILKWSCLLAFNLIRFLDSSLAFFRTHQYIMVFNSSTGFCLDARPLFSQCQEFLKFVSGCFFIVGQRYKTLAVFPSYHPSPLLSGNRFFFILPSTKKILLLNYTWLLHCFLGKINTHWCH